MNFVAKPICVEALPVTEAMRIAHSGKLEGFPRELRDLYHRGKVYFTDRYVEIELPTHRVRCNSTDWIVCGPVGTLTVMGWEAFQDSFDAAPSLRREMSEDEMKVRLFGELPFPSPDDVSRRR